MISAQGGAIDNGYSSHMFLNDCPLPDVSLVVLAQWEETEEYDDEYGYFEKTYHCSKCQSSFSVKTNYCPNCGAKIKNGRIGTSSRFGNAGNPASIN